MTVRCRSLVLALILLVPVVPTATTEPSCTVHRDGEIRCTLPSAPQRVLLLEDRLIVGATNYIFSFSPDLEFLDSQDISPSASRQEQCVREAHQSALCRNIVRVVSLVNETKILVCGTNAVFPKCRLHQSSNLSAWNYMTPEDRKDVGFSPHDDITANVAVTTSNGKFFSATSFNFRQKQQTIGMAPLFPEGDRTPSITVQTPSSNLQWINDPVFVSAYDVGEHVYFFAREPAFEVSERQVEYSRAIRVCKNDSGFHLFPSDETFTFRTFQKARLQCRAEGEDGSIPYDYDRLQATFLQQPSDGGEPTLYGAFSSPTNGPEGAALCKFSFSSIQSVFEDGRYSVLEGTEWKIATPGTFACPGTQRTTEQARTQQLVYSVASAKPMYRISGDDFTQMAVDVAEYGGDPLEVIVLSQRGGMIVLLVLFRKNTYKNTVKIVDNDVTNILVHKDPLSEERRVIFTTNDNVQSFTLGKCHLHRTCFECFDSHDPYCAWNLTSGSCINKLATINTASLPDSLTSNEDTIVNVCGNRTTVPTQVPVDPSTCPPIPTVTVATPTTTDPTTTDPTTTHPTDPSGSDEPSGGTDVPVNVAAGVESDSEEKRESVGLLAGATVGGFLFGIPVGLVVCYLFFSVFLKKNTKSPETAVRSTRASIEVNHNHLQGPPTGDEKRVVTNSSRCLELTQMVHRNPTTKNVNQIDEEDDVLMDLPITKGSSNIPQSAHHLQHSRPRTVPGHSVPRGRTESTRWLRASESSDMESSLELSPPLTSPV